MIKLKDIKKIKQVEEVGEIPFPTSEEVKKWLIAWNKLEDYVMQEEAIDELFVKQYPLNNNLKQIIIKCSVLNDFYSTNIFKIYPVAKRIYDLKIDDYLQKKDISIVEKIKYVEINGITKNFYSFATKYCSHHDNETYPIFDSFVKKMLIYFRDKDHFYNFENDDLLNYIKFKDILVNFRKYYKLTDFSLKQIDKYLWQSGKKYFPKKY